MLNTQAREVDTIIHEKVKSFFNLNEINQKRVFLERTSNIKFQTQNKYHFELLSVIVVLMYSKKLFLRCASFVFKS